MTFSTRLRLTLLAAAILPTILITIIVVTGISEQIKRIEHREAVLACDRFEDLLGNTSARVEKSIRYVADSRAFQISELNLQAKRRSSSRYRLPLLSLDFLEYVDSSGRVLLSADRPALVGQVLPPSDIADPYFVYKYENDYRGSHPSLICIIPTQSGYLYGGIFLDLSFNSLAAAVTRSQISFLDKRNVSDGSPLQQPDKSVGNPYREENQFRAVIFNEEPSEYFIFGRFDPSGLDIVFNNFYTAVGGVTIFSLIVVITAGLYFTSRTRREIQNLREGAVRVASGDLSSQVITRGEDEFSELAESFNSMMKQLSDSQKRLVMTEKIAAWQSIGRKVAHEVKNPLTPIAIAADDLRRSYSERQPDFEKILSECTGTITREVDRLKKLIDRFSAFAQMPAPEIKEFDINRVVDEIKILYKDQIEAGRVELKNNLSHPIVRADLEQLLQVLINLIKNSLEADAGKCQAEFQSLHDGIRITIEDDGPGFPEKILTDGITPYHSTKKEGSGLGLLICQRIVFDHIGTMNVENKKDGGARVSITLPQENV
ncbi:MAG: ATP-binding protein [candidate division Zixibacteria bacterium]